MAKSNMIGGMMDLQQLFSQLERVPQRVATRAARRGAAIGLRAARANAPEDTGQLKRGIILKRERSQSKGKAVYQVTIDPKMNNVFVKMTGGGAVSKKKRAYYPASMEYGFMTVDGGYIPGYRYLRRAADDNATRIESEILRETTKEIDKALSGKGGRK